MTLLINVIFAIFLLVGCSSESRVGPSTDTSSKSAKELKLLDTFKRNPLADPHAGLWFTRLPLDKKREYAKRMGVILLQDSNEQAFVFGVGAKQSPYPWTIQVSKNQCQLGQHGEFRWVHRDDAWVKRTWGVLWTVRQRYTTKTPSNGEPIFIKTPPDGKGQRGCNCWIPASGWKYVGPTLAKDTTYRFPPPVSQMALANENVHGLGLRKKVLTTVDIRLLDKQEVVVIGKYQAIPMPVKGTKDHPRSSAPLFDYGIILLSDGTRIYLESFDTPQARRSPQEIKRFEGKQVAVRGTIHQRMPSRGQAPLAPAVIDIKSISVVR